MLKQHKDKEKENKQNPNQGRMKSSNNVKHDEEAAGVSNFQQQCLLQAVSLSLWLVHDAQQRCRAEMRKLSKALAQQQTQAPAAGGKKGGPPHYGAAAGVVGTTITTNSTTALQLGASTTLLPSVVSKWFHASLDLLGLLLVEHEQRGWRKSKTTSLSSSHRTSSLSASAVPAKSAPSAVSGVDEVESAITKVTSLIHVLLCRLTHFLVHCGGSQIEPMTTSTTSSAQEVASSTNIMISSSSSTSKSTSGLLQQAYSTKGMRKFLACCDPENTFRVGFLSVLKDDQYAALPLPLLPPATARFLSYWLPFQTARFLARAAEGTTSNKNAGAPPHLRYDKQVIVDLYREAAENAKRLLEVAGQEYNSLYFQILYEQQRFVLEKSSVTNLQARYARVYPQEFYAPFLNSSHSLPVLGEDNQTTSSSKINTSSQIAAQREHKKPSSAVPRPPSPSATWWKEVYCSRACFAVVRDYLRTMGGGSSSSGAAGGGAGASTVNPPTKNFPEKEQQECYEWCRKGLQHFEKAVGVGQHLRMIAGVDDLARARQDVEVSTSFRTTSLPPWAARNSSPGNYRRGGVGRGPYKTDVDRFTVLFGSCLDLTAGAGRAAAVRYDSAQEQVEDEVKQQQQEEPQHLSLSPQEPEGQHVVGLQIEMLTTLVACLHRAVAALPQVAGGSSAGHQHTSTEQPRKSFPTGKNSSKYMLEYEALPGGRQFGHDVPDTELQRVMLEQPFRAVCRLTQATVFGLQQVVNQIQELSPFSSTSNAELNDEDMMLAMAIYAISSLEAAERVASFLQSIVVPRIHDHFVGSLHGMWYTCHTLYVLQSQLRKFEDLLKDPATKQIFARLRRMSSKTAATHVVAFGGKNKNQQQWSTTTIGGHQLYHDDTGGPRAVERTVNSLELFSSKRATDVYKSALCHFLLGEFCDTRPSKGKKFRLDDMQRLFPGLDEVAWMQKRLRSMKKPLSPFKI
ncbi:unnamed protein product [Amoebophrya sp. A120]|nr:unnamed protein product [Amoebophrya sp. A120]|eukprot:GSA120T00008183001.1